MVLKAEIAALVIMFVAMIVLVVVKLGVEGGEDHFDGGGDFDECGGGDRDI